MSPPSTPPLVCLFTIGAGNQGTCEPHGRGRPIRPSPDTCRASSQADHDIDGLAVPGTVVRDPAPPAVHPDEAIEQCQAPAGFVVGGCLPPDRAAWAVVLDFRPKVTAH